MKCLLTIIDGPAAGTSIPLKPGETLTVGRSKPAAFVIEDDPLLSGVHFAVKLAESSCVVEDLGSTNKTFVNNQCITRAEVKSGDVVSGGNSFFEVSLLPEESAMPAPTSQSPTRSTLVAAAGSSAAQQTAFKSAFVANRAADVLARFSLNEEPFKGTEQNETPHQLVDRLVGRGQLSEALKFLAYALPKRGAVWWACRCVRRGVGQALKLEELEPLNAAEAWAAEPSEESRRLAMAAADKCGHGRAAAWPAVGAFWSAGSMAPANAPVVPPGEDLTGKAVFGAVQMAAVAQQPAKAADKQKEFIELALAIERGEKLWKQDST